MFVLTVDMLQVCGWVDAVATKPVWAKMTPNITDIKVPARASLAAGMEGVAAINTIQSVIGNSLRPLCHGICSVRLCLLALVMALLRHPIVCKAFSPLHFGVWALPHLSR